MEGRTRRKVVLGLAGMGLSAGIAWPLAFFQRKNSHSDEAARVLEVGRLREGDILFVIGTSFISSVIRASQGPFAYTHAGLLVSGKGRLVVIDSDYDPDLNRDGVSLQDVRDFARKVDRVLVLSNPALLPEQRRLISQAALKLQGKKFDLALNPDADRLYCTELIARALMALPDSPITLERDRFLTPAFLYDRLLANGWRQEILTNQLYAPGF